MKTVNQTLTEIALFLTGAEKKPYWIGTIILFNGTRPNEYQNEVARCLLENRPKHLILNPL